MFFYCRHSLATLSSSPVGVHDLDEDAQLLHARIGAHPHADDAETEAGVGLVQLHLEQSHLVYPLLQLVLGRGTHRVYLVVPSVQLMHRVRVGDLNRRILTSPSRNPKSNSQRIRFQKRKSRSSRGKGWKQKVHNRFSSPKGASALNQTRDS